MGIGWVAPGGILPTGPAGGDLADTYPNPTVGKIAGDAITQAANTIYVDANGDAASAGTNPATPTTFTAAMTAAVGAADTHVVLAASATPYTTGGTITVTADAVTFSSRQGGTQATGATVSDPIAVLGSGFRASGVRFDGALDLGGNGAHYFGGCAAGAGVTITRTNPIGPVTITNCDFGSATYTATGAGSGSLVIDGAASSFGTINCGTATHTVFLGDIASCARVTMSAGILLAAQATIIDPTLAVDAAAGTTVNLLRTACVTSAGAPVPITASGTYTLTDVVYDKTTSTLGTAVGTPSDFSAGVRGTLRSLRPPAARVTSLISNTPPGPAPFAAAQTYLTYGPIDVDVSKTYRGILSLFTEVTANNTEFWFEVFVNGTPLSLIPGTNVLPSQQPLGSAGSVSDVGGNIIIQNFPTGTYTLTVRVALGAGPGNVNYRTGSFEVFERIPNE